MQITLRHDPERIILVPNVERSTDERVRWERETGYPFAAILGESTIEGFLPVSDRTRVEALDRADTRVGEDWAL